MTALNLTVNGKPHATDAATVTALLAELGLDKQAVAVEVNKQLVPKRSHAETALQEGDVLEMVTLVGGG